MRLIEESELSQIERAYDNMLMSAAVNIHNRPRIDSFDNVNRPVSFLVIPTLEGLKYALFEQTDPAHEVENPLK